MLIILVHRNLFRLLRAIRWSSARRQPVSSSSLRVYPIATLRRVDKLTAELSMCGPLILQHRSTPVRMQLLLLQHWFVNARIRPWLWPCAIAWRSLILGRAQTISSVEETVIIKLLRFECFNLIDYWEFQNKNFNKFDLMQLSHRICWNFRFEMLEFEMWIRYVVFHAAAQRYSWSKWNDLWHDEWGWEKMINYKIRLYFTFKMEIDWLWYHFEQTLYEFW